MAHHEYFSPVRIALQQEIQNHPELIARLQPFLKEGFEERLAAVAMYCGIALDGYYDGRDIDNICGLCLEELKKRSTLILTA